MKAIVTGGCGFIGSHLVDLLLKKNISTIVLDNFSTGRRQNLDHVKDNPLLTIIEFDISDTSANLNQHFMDADYVFHLAALADIVPSVQNPVKYYKSNVESTLNLIKYCNSLALDFFAYTSTISIFGQPKVF